MYDWYFNNDATKGTIVKGVNNASCPMKGIDQVHLVLELEDAMTLLEVMYMRGIKKNLFSISTLFAYRFKVIFYG